MYDYCREKHKKIFEGPGTDILDEKKPSLISTLAGGIYGGSGINSVKHNLESAKNYLLDLYKTNNKEPLDIHLFGWSRGAYIVDVLKHAPIDLVKKGQIKIAEIHIHNIDPVPGGPKDRVDLGSSLSTALTSIKITSTTHYSNTGNVEVWDNSKLNYLMNLPFFTALDDQTPNAKKYLYEGNHEDVAGHARAGNILVKRP